MPLSSYNTPSAITADPREEKLPKWAQDALVSLRRQVEDERARADAARSGTHPENTNTVADPYDREPIRLPDGVGIEFRLPSGSVHARVSSAGREPYLSITTLHGLLIVQPQSGNAVRITADRR